MITQYEVNCKLNQLNVLLDTLLALNYQKPYHEEIMSGIYDIYCIYEVLSKTLDKAIDEINVKICDNR